MFSKDALRVLNSNHVLCLLMVLVVAAAPAALASDDPPPEPEWGGHATERPFLDPGFSVCDLGAKERELWGGAVGGIIGGILGAQMGDGESQLAATAVGTLLGAALGGSPARRRRRHGQVLHRRNPGPRARRSDGDVA